jgi:hypothetical protein
VFKFQISSSSLNYWPVDSIGGANQEKGGEVNKKPDPQSSPPAVIHQVTGLKDGKRIEVECSINGKPVKCLLDTGSDTTLIKSSAVSKIRAEIVSNEPVKLLLADSSTLEPLGQVEIEIIIGGKAIKKKVPVVNNLQYDCILGLDVLNAVTKVKNLLNKLQKQIKTHKVSIKPKNNKRITKIKGKRMKKRANVRVETPTSKIMAVKNEELAF